MIYSFLFFIFCILSLPMVLYRWIKQGRYKKNLPYRLGLRSHPLPSFNGRPLVWFHGVSLGEISALSPFFHAFSLQYPDIPCLITASTETGFEQAKRLFPKTAIRYMPLDFLFLYRKMFQNKNIQSLFIMETEIWPNLLRFASEKKTPVFLLNARISPRSFPRYQWAVPFLKNDLQHITHVFAQSEIDRERFEAIGVTPSQLTAAGNLKYDAIQISSETPSSKSPYFIAGSTHPGESEILLEAFLSLRKKHPEAKFILCPRHWERSSDLIQKLNTGAALSWTRFSQDPSLSLPITLVDQTGVLKDLYSKARLAYVGGSLVPVGGHNLLEAAAVGIPVLSGPFLQNAPDVKETLIEKGLIIVNNKEELEEELIELWNRPDRRAALGKKAITSIQEQQGAAKKILERVAPFLSENSL